jgi:hypothetical protein
MKPGVPKSILFAKGLMDIPYTCETCGTKAVRTVKQE